MRFVTPENKHLATPEAVDLMDKLLRYDHVVRWRSRKRYVVVISHRFLFPCSCSSFTLVSKPPTTITITTTQERLTAQEAMAHPFFDAVRKNREAGGAAAGKAAEGST
jgi:hypothetical protein